MTTNISKAKEVLIFDIEVFKHDTIIVFKRYNMHGYLSMHNDFKGLKDLIKDKLLVGFNNYNYDNYILAAILQGKNQEEIKKINDYIISGSDVKNLGLNKEVYSINSLDTFQELPNRISLKEFQANYGMDIEETPISFDLNRPLTGAELDLVKKYCQHDVFATEKLLNERIESYFNPKIQLCNMSDKNSIRWNTTTIAADILTDGNKVIPWKDTKFNIMLLKFVPVEVVAYWAKNYIESAQGKSVSAFNIEVDGYNLSFGFGGLHLGEKVIAKDVVLLDVSSMYPNIIVNNKLLDDKTNIYNDILKKRIIEKNEGNIVKSNALKLILNSVYGNFKNQYSNLYNPMAAISTCLLGQIAIFNLFDRLKNHGEIININTDGIAFVPKNNLWKKIAIDWMDDWELPLTHKYYTKWIQKDVNNYVALAKDGSITTKGADTSKYEYDVLGKVKANIVDKCVVNYLLHDIPIKETILNNLNEPKLFQIVLKNTNKFVATVDQNGIATNKVNRVFASKNTDTCLYRLKENGNTAKFPDAPSKMYVYNEDLDNLDIKEFKEIIDVEYYEALVDKKLRNWPNPKIIYLDEVENINNHEERKII